MASFHDSPIEARPQPGGGTNPISDGNKFFREQRSSLEIGKTSLDVPSGPLDPAPPPIQQERLAPAPNRQPDLSGSVGGRRHPSPVEDRS